MTPGLRERKRRQTRERIQRTALDLFDEHGFNRVSIEQIADTAEVSPSSVYRYFGTKEGIVIADEFDTLTDSQLADLIDPDDLLGSVAVIVAGLDAATESDDVATRRIGYFFSEPTIRRAALEAFAGIADRIAAVLAGSPRFTIAQARTTAHALVFAHFAVLEQWHRDGAHEPLSVAARESLSALRSLA